MNRRDVLHLFGGALALPLSDDVYRLGRELQARARRDSLPRALDPHQNETVAVIAELIIPTTDTPGARAARVPEFIDLALADWYDAADRERFLAGLADVDSRARTLFGGDFVRCTEPQQVQVVTALDEELTKARAAAERGGRSSDGNFFHMIKRLTIVGYYTSEIGATQELHDQIIPGRFDGCYPLEPGAR